MSSLIMTNVRRDFKEFQGEFNVEFNATVNEEKTSRFSDKNLDGFPNMHSAFSTLNFNIFIVEFNVRVMEEKTTKFSEKNLDEFPNMHSRFATLKKEKVG